MHASGTYSLPFSRGRKFFNQNAIANAAIGGCTLGTIVTWQSGEPNVMTL